MCIRIDRKLKEQAEDVLSQLGMTMNGTINMFLQQIVREQAVPLNLSLKSEKENRLLTINEIKYHTQKLLKKYHAENAMLFGSYARGDADVKSDVDIIIYGGSEFDLTDVYSIAEELNSCLKKDVDIYEISEINKESDFYNNIIAEGVMIA